MKASIFDYATANFYSFAIFLMGPPESYDPGEFSNALEATDAHAITPDHWTRFPWSQGRPAKHGDIAVNFTRRSWKDWNRKSPAGGTILKSGGLLEFVSHVRQCDRRQATRLVADFARRTAHDEAV